MIKQISSASELKAQNVRLVMPEGAVVVATAEAIRRSTLEGLDLILLQDGDVPVVKICDVRKMQYEREKGQSGGKPKKVKHVQIGPHTAEHDLVRIAAKATEFIGEGHPVVLRMEVRGRDRIFSDLIKKQVEKFAGRIEGAKPGKLTYSNRGSVATYTMNLT